MLTAALTQQTERLKFLVAFRPGFLSPTLAAQMAATFQRLSGGRLLLNIVTGGDAAEQRGYGDFLDKDDRYAQTGEFLAVLRGALDRGARLRRRARPVEGARVADPPERPPIYLGGSSPAAIEVAARHVDVYLTWGEPPAQVAEKLDRVRAAAARAGRELRFGIRLHVITRDTAEEAWAEADRLLAGLDPRPSRRPAPLRRIESVGQRRMVGLHEGRRTSSRSPPTSGRASGWCATARAPRWSAATRRSPRASRSTTRWGSTSSSSPAIRTSKRPTGSARRCSRCCARRPARGVPDGPPA